MNRILSFRAFVTPLYLVLVSVIMFSCKSSQPAVDSKDLSYLYNPTKSSVKPRFSIVNKDDESTELSIKFFASTLFFSEANPQGIPMAQLAASVKLYSLTGGRALVDTAFYDLKIIKVKSQPEYIYKIPLKVAPGNEYMADVKILDRIKEDVMQSFLQFNTLSDENKYNFIARGHFNKSELFSPTVRANEFVNIVYPRKPVDSLYISFYKSFKEIPYPPAILLPEKTVDYDPDTIIALSFSDTIPIMFPKEGIYFCSVNRANSEGYTFYNFGESFPSTTNPEGMTEPLAYLVTEDELNSLRSAPDQKLALDEFWIRCGGNIERARELIRIYYTRILYSNLYFTSYKEGWRTERGMIYTIYGPPDKVYKSADGESWGYRKPVLRSSWGGRYHLKEEYLYFNFRYRTGKFSDNDYYLSRSETLVTYWDQAIASWRKGIVYRLDNPEDF